MKSNYKLKMLFSFNCIPGFFVLLFSLFISNCWAHPLVTSYAEGANEEESELESLLPFLLLSNISIPVWKVHRIPGFALDGNVSDFLATEGITDNNNPILEIDSTSDNTGIAGTDIIQVWMGHDGANFVFYFQTEAVPPNSSFCNSGGCFYQLNIADWLINVNRSGGVAQRIIARKFFGETAGCQTLTTTETQLVDNNPAGYYGFEVRVDPSCLEVTTNSSILTHDRSSGHTFDVTADFTSIFWDQMDISQKSVTWDFASF
jgi:hypothetical protein